MTRINTAVATRFIPTSSSQAQAQVGSNKSTSETAKAPRDGFQEKAAPPAWVHVKAHDASAGAALRKLEKKAGREVDAEELTRAIQAGTADKDAQFTKKEFQDFAAWALRNAGRLTSGAKKVMALYTKAARAAHGDPLSAAQYVKLMREMSGVKEAAPTDPTKPPPKPEKKSVLDDPKSWFISQTKTKKYNSHEDNGSGNCGPTSLTMIARAFGKVHGGAGKMDDAIEHTRRDMMKAGKNEDNGTSIGQIKNGAEKYGLKTHKQTGHGKNTTARLNDTIDHIKKNLAKGRPVIVHGVMIRSEHDPRASKYGEGGHYFVVTKITKNKDGKWVAKLNDPNWPDGPRTVPLSHLRESIRRRGTFATLAVWDKK